MIVVVFAHQSLRGGDCQGSELVYHKERGIGDQWNWKIDSAGNEVVGTRGGGEFER
jgi:hypothetical protein